LPPATRNMRDGKGKKKGGNRKSLKIQRSCLDRAKENRKEKKKGRKKRNDRNQYFLKLMIKKEERKKKKLKKKGKEKVPAIPLSSKGGKKKKRKERHLCGEREKNAKKRGGELSSLHVFLPLDCKKRSGKRRGKKIARG